MCKLEAFSSVLFPASLFDAYMKWTSARYSTPGRVVFKPPELQAGCGVRLSVLTINGSFRAVERLVCVGKEEQRVNQVAADPAKVRAKRGEGVWPPACWYAQRKWTQGGFCYAAAVHSILGV